MGQMLDFAQFLNYKTIEVPVQCGSKLGWKCSQCGRINDPDDKFCGESVQGLRTLSMKMI